MTTKRLSKTGIEYGDLNWSVYPGCLHKPQGKCPVPTCWAEAMSKRQMGAAAKKGITLPDFHQPHLIPELLLAPLSVKKPSTILVNFMGDLFGDWVNPSAAIGNECSYEHNGIIHLITPEIKLKMAVFEVIKRTPQHTFLFLTKNPKGLIPWSPFPDNAWVGATVWDLESLNNACHYLALTDIKHRWLSIEPLLGSVSF